jgi:hypothetical protein
MYGEDIKKQFDDFAVLLDAAEVQYGQFQDFDRDEDGQQVNLSKDNYKEIFGLANKYKVKVLGNFCINYIHVKATSGKLDWDALKKLPIITAISTMLLKAEEKAVVQELNPRTSF